MNISFDTFLCMQGGRSRRQLSRIPCGRHSVSHHSVVEIPGARPALDSIRLQLGRGGSPGVLPSGDERPKTAADAPRRRGIWKVRSVDL